MVIRIEPGKLVVAQLINLNAGRVNRAKCQGFKLKKFTKFRFTGTLITDQVFDAYPPAARPIQPRFV